MNTAVATKMPSPVAVARNELDTMTPQFEAALPAHVPVERFKRVVMTALQNNTDLLGCDRRSLWNSAMKAAQDGLLPDGREGAIVKYGNQAQWLPMIGGLRKKVRNSGEIATWDVYIVHENDDFDFQLGDEPFIKHKPALVNPGKPIAAYSVAILKTGEKSREVMSIEAIEKIRARSKASKNGPWVTDYEEMCRKTVARRHSKVLPMSTDLDDLMRRDDELYDFDGAKDEAREHRRVTRTGNVLDAFAGKSEPEAEPVSDNGSEPQTDGKAADIEGDAGSPDNPMPEFSAADAYAMGKEHHAKGRPLKSPPPEWRDGSQPAFLEAWEAGWRDADNEAQAAKKK